VESSDLCIDHWNQFKTSANTNTDAKKTLDAATYVFDHYQDLCKSFGGWPPQELLFNTALLNKHRDRLVQCLFLHEAQLSFSMSGMSERSRARFEYSRLPRLLMILIRMESRHRGGGLYHSHDAYIDAETVLRVLAEAGRWTYSDDSFFHPQGEALYSLAERCYRRGLLRQPEIEERALAAAHMTFFYDVASAIKFKHRFPDFLYNSLGDFFLEHRSLRIDEVIERAEKIFDHQMRHIGSGKDIYLKEAEGPSFAPSQFNIESLEQVGGLEIRWTDCLDQHLRISSRPHTIQIFAHPTWLYNQVDLQK